MKIHDIGGEFALIERLARQSPISHPDLFTGIGDDAAVIQGVFSDGEYLLVTTDMLVEAIHFRRDWSSPEQIGVKAVTCNISDIAAMGGAPTFMFVSIALPPDTDVLWTEALYRGMADASRRYGAVLAGGDTTHGDVITISITLMGRATPKSLCLRSQARPGDLLCVTGPLGGSAAGLMILTAGLDLPENTREKHLTPGCRMDVSPIIAPLAGAMIDISDGLAAEVNHICQKSATGAQIDVTRIPIHPSVEMICRRIDKKPVDFALSGGEDFELLFSIAPEKIDLLEKKGVSPIVIGKVTEASHGCTLIFPDGRKAPVKGGYNHFTPVPNP